MKAERKQYDGMTKAEFNARAREDEAGEADHVPFNPRVATSLQVARRGIREPSSTIKVS